MVSFFLVVVLLFSTDKKKVFLLDFLFLVLAKELLVPHDLEKY